MGSRRGEGDEWKGIVSLFEPMEEPNDPHGLNEKSFDGFHYIQFLMAAIPIIGLSVPISGFMLFVDRYPKNEFNLTEMLRKTTMYSLMIQMVSLLLVGAIFL